MKHRFRARRTARGTRRFSRCAARRGTTLVELVVCMALLSVFGMAAVALIRPCAETFTRMQRLSRAQMIGDTVAEYLRGELLHAQGELRFVGGSAQEGSPGVCFQLAAGLDKPTYYEELTAGAITNLTVQKKGAAAQTANAPAGRLHTVFYTIPTGAGAAAGPPACTDTPGPTAYACTDVYPEKFYMDLAVQLTFRAIAVEPCTRRVTALEVRIDVGRPAQDGAAPETVYHTQRAVLDLADRPLQVGG